jgi:hypothetical protein
MSNVTAVQQEVGEVLVSEMGLDGVRASASGGLTFKVDGTDVLIDVFDRGTDGAAGTVVSIYAPVGAEVPITPELLGWVAQQSGAWIFGHVVVAPDADAPERCFLTMSHNLLGEFLNRVELSSVVIAVASSAAELTRQVESRFGGLEIPAG